MIPDFYKIGQDYIWQAQAMHESITPYSMRTYNLLTRLERKFTKRLRVSVSAKFEELLVTEESVDNGEFWLLELPIYVRWSTANSLLNPTKGAWVEYRATPSFNLSKPSGFYLYQRVTQANFLPDRPQPMAGLSRKIDLGLHCKPITWSGSCS